MTIYIRSKKHTMTLSTDKEALIHAVLNLPHTEETDATPGKTVSALEAEVVSCSDHEGVVLGTENLGSCITLYLYGGGQRLLIHVNDGMADLCLNDRLAIFPKKEKIHAVLVGGDDIEGDSQANFSRILSLLVDTDRKVHIVSQRLFDRPVKSAEGIYHNLFALCVRKFKFFYKHLYGANMPESLLWKLDKNNFKNKITPYFDEETFTNIMKIMFSMDGLLKPEVHESFEKIRMQRRFDNLDGINFMCLMREIVSCRGFLMMATDAFSHVTISNNDFNAIYFAHREDGQVSIGRIIPDMKSEFHVERTLYLYQKGRTRSNEHYFDAYKNGKFQLPKLCDEYQKNILELKSGIRDRIKTPDVVNKIHEIANVSSDNFHVQQFADAVQNYSPLVLTRTVTYQYLMDRSDTPNENNQLGQHTKRLKMGVE